MAAGVLTGEGSVWCSIAGRRRQGSVGERGNKAERRRGPPAANSSRRRAGRLRHGEHVVSPAAAAAAAGRERALGEGPLLRTARGRASGPIVSRQPGVRRWGGSAGSLPEVATAATSARVAATVGQSHKGGRASPARGPAHAATAAAAERSYLTSFPFPQF